MDFGTKHIYTLQEVTLNSLMNWNEDVLSVLICKAYMLLI